ncbi:YeeE/YedE family protein [Salinarimonas sp.]|uniref:YeeE/YedE family protein n=1 Tax=Salinarimonas sp. TaxID=2766526 RepID=UPI0032D9984F
MTELLEANLVRTALGFLAGAALGFIARRGRFCTLGAIEDAVYARDTRRLRAWALAIAVAIAGVLALTLASEFDLSRTIYVGPRLEWAGALLGGLVFGLGMALVGTCGFGMLLRLGGGDLKALLGFLVLGFSALMAMRGLTGVPRIALLDPLALDLAPRDAQTLPTLFGLTGAGATAFALAVAGAFGALALAHDGLRAAPKLIATGLGIGAMVVLGFAITGVVGFDPFEEGRVESFTFVAPLGETLLWAALSTGIAVDFPVGATLGVLAGAFLAARVHGEFFWEAPDDARELKRHVLGGFLMGTGGVTALGCTIGQGVSGVATLSVGSFLALAAIFAGARVGLWILVER